jgi:hypothetical protein
LEGFTVFQNIKNDYTIGDFLTFLKRIPYEIPFIDTGLLTDYNFYIQRVSPSGKAVPSQGTIRGFESHHPLKRFPVFGKLFY